MALQNQEIGARIRLLRGRRPQTVIAEALGVGERTYQTWEHGDAKPSYRSLQKLADYFGVTEGFILEGLDDGNAGGTPNPFKVSDQLEDVVTTFHARVDDVEGRLGKIEQNQKKFREDQKALHEDVQAMIRLMTRILEFGPGTTVADALAQGLRDAATKAPPKPARQAKT